jgi:large subunit ribosomal protein L30
MVAKKAKKLQITQVKSPIGHTKDQSATLHSLGLHRIGETVVKEDRPEFRGMANAVRHLVKVEEI